MLRLRPALRVGQVTAPGAFETRDLDSFDAQTREQVLRALVAATEAGDPGPNVNMHAHSFYSYNAAGFSPSRIVYEARARGLHAAGLCDFDVLDGLEEFHAAGAIAGLRTCVFLETRAFVAPSSSNILTFPAS